MYISVSGYLKKKAVFAKMELKTSVTVNCSEFLCTSRFINRSLDFFLSKPHLLSIICVCFSVGLTNSFAAQWQKLQTRVQTLNQMLN